MKIVSRFAPVCTFLSFPLFLPACSDSAPVAGPFDPTSTVSQKLTVDDLASTGGNPNFGSAIAVSGDTAVIGAYVDTPRDYPPQAGSAYVFQLDADGHWRRVKKLTAPTPNPQIFDNALRNAFFGYAVGISGDTIVVGEYYRHGATAREGAAYVFARHAGGIDNWGLTKQLLPSDPVTESAFGWSVDIEDDTIVVGRSGGESSSANSAVYVFERNAGGPGNWGEVQNLLPDDPNSVFGFAVALRGDQLAVGAGLFIYAGGEGAVYVFRRDASGTWQKVKRIAAGDTSDGSPEDAFGSTVAFDGETLVVGGPSKAWGEFGGGGVAGSAYVFSRNRGGADNWGEVTKLTHPDPLSDQGNGFGLAAALNGDTALVGAPFSDVDGATESGAVFVFERNAGGLDRWGLIGRLAACRT